jgi:hypothetical protein
MYSARSDFELKDHDIPATKKTKGLWGDFLADVLGINDAKNCFQHGSVEGCAWTASNFIPGVDGIKAAGKFFKGVHDAAEAAKARKAAKALEDAGKCLTKNSFAPDTEVLTADGKSKPIKDLKVGDDVKTGDPTTGQPSGSHKITATMINRDSNLLDVVITTADGHRDVLHTTTEHPFWDATAHAWVDAAALTPGHMLVTAANQRVAVSGILRLPSPAKDMYNLTVQDLHTYYVLAGETSVLVHNSSCPVPISKGRWDHIWDRHVNRSKYPNKSKFNTTSRAKIEKMINRALDGETDDGVYFYRFPSSIGTTAAGDPQYYIRVVVRDRKLITAFPSDAP